MAETVVANASGLRVFAADAADVRSKQEATLGLKVKGVPETLMPCVANEGGAELYRLSIYLMDQVR
mgnify:CR=1 FL=1